MAVKPITNKQIVSSQKINRANQTSTKQLSDRGANKAVSFVPGANSSKNYAVTLKDVDTSIMNFVKNIIRPSIKENSEVFKVPVYYGNEERWKAARKRGVLRDKQGALILPLIILKRTEVAKNTDLSVGMEHDLKRNSDGVVVGQKWSATNKYDRFAVLQGQTPVTEYSVTSMPNYVNVVYEFVLWTNFIEQMNPLIESFTEFNNQYWGDRLEHKFYCFYDTISDASEMNQNGERFIKSNFSVNTKAYLLPEDYNSVVTNKVASLQTKRSVSKIVWKENIV